LISLISHELSRESVRPYESLSRRAPYILARGIWLVTGFCGSQNSPLHYLGGGLLGCDEFFRCVTSASALVCPLPAEASSSRISCLFYGKKWIRPFARVFPSLRSTFNKKKSGNRNICSQTEYYCKKSKQCHLRALPVVISYLRCASPVFSPLSWRPFRYLNYFS